MTDAGAMAAATDNPSLPPAGLQCTLCSEVVENNETSNTLELFFRPDETKKSVFWLDAPATSSAQSHSVNAPAHCYIDCQSTIFFLGGFQLVSNAKTVEIYTVSAENNSNNEEEYLTTSRGIPSQETPGSFKVMCVVPGGPRPILRLHLKLLSLKPSNESTAQLVSIKLTARIPQAQAAQAAGTQTQTQSTMPLQPQPSNTDTSVSASTAPSLASMMNNTDTNTLPNQQSGPTMEDVGAAMAGVSFMVRSTEDRLVETMQAGFSRLQVAAQSSQSVDVRLQILQQTVISQTTLLEQQHATMQQQHVLLEQQGRALETLKQQQQDLLGAFRIIHTQFTAMDTPPSRTDSEPGIVEAAAAGAAATTVEDMDERPLEVPEAGAVQADEADADNASAGESFSEDTLDESDVVFVENDATSSSKHDKEPVTQDSEEELHIGNDDVPFADGGEGSDDLILVTDD
jgi:hypothetical protein